MKTPSDRITEIERNTNTLMVKALSLKLALSKGEFREEDHPRADDGKFGSGGGSSSSGKPQSEKTTFSPVSHTMAKTILSRSDKERSKDIDTLAKMPKKTLKERASSIQSQINDAREESKKDPDNPKWKDVLEALSKMHGDVTAAMS